MNIELKIENLEKSILVVNELLEKSFNKIDIMEREILFLKNQNLGYINHSSNNNIDYITKNKIHNDVNNDVNKDVEVNLDNLLMTKSMNLSPPKIHRQNAFYNIEFI